ncbi:unnamed protein product, partial [marine sediment metagenome]
MGGVKPFQQSVTDYRNERSYRILPQTWKFPGFTGDACELFVQAFSLSVKTAQAEAAPMNPLVKTHQCLLRYRRTYD